MTTTHTFLLFATLTTLGACGDKDIDASDDSGTAGIPTQAADDTGAMDTGDFDTGILAADDADDAEDDEADPTAPGDTGVYEKGYPADGSNSNKRTSIENVGTMPAATDLGSEIGPAVATGALSTGPNNWYGLCVSNTFDAPDASFWWTPPVTGTYTISTFGSMAMDTMLTVLELGHDSFTSVACNDDSYVADPGDPTGGPLYYQSIIENQVLTAGHQYLIVIEEWVPFIPPLDGYQLNIDLISVSETGDPGTIDPERGE
jgi:hypothetical protein